MNRDILFGLSRRGKLNPMPMKRIQDQLLNLKQIFNLFIGGFREFMGIYNHFVECISQLIYLVQIYFDSWILLLSTKMFVPNKENTVIKYFQNKIVEIPRRNGSGDSNWIANFQTYKLGGELHNCGHRPDCAANRFVHF
jgi:hypothetical protein